MANSYEFILENNRYSWYKRLPIEKWRVMRQYVYKRDNGRCLYCDNPVELYACHIHHILELSRGGTNHPTNLKTLCIDCHEKRHPHMLSSIKGMARI